MRARLILALLLTAVAPFAGAQQTFEVAVSGRDIGDACMITPAVTHLVRWYNPDAVAYENVSQIAPAGTSLLALRNGSPLAIVELLPDGSVIPFYTGTGSPFGVSLDTSPDGRVWVSTGGPVNELLRLSAATGVIEAGFEMPGSTIEVGSDNCTIYYAPVSNPTVIRRLNGCTGAALPDFASTPWINDFAVLPDGQVVIATGTQIHLYNAAGAFVRVVGDLNTYGLGGNEPTAVAVRGGTVFVAATNWCDAGSSVLLRIALLDGTEIARAALEMNYADSIVVNAANVPIPTLGEMALVLLTFVLAAAGALAMKLR